MRYLSISCLVAALLSHAGPTAARLPGEQRIPNLAASLALPTTTTGHLPGEERVPVVVVHLPEEERVADLAAAVSAQKQAILDRKKRAAQIKLRKER